MEEKYFIIGASSGIGKAISERLIQNGHTVYGTYLQSDITKLALTKSYQYDVREDDPSSLELPETLNGLIYCPGSMRLKPFHLMTDKEFEEDFQLNVLGAIRLTKHFQQQLKTTKGSILYFSTVAVHLGMKYHASIACSKGAIEGLTRSLAAEFAPHIRVNCIAPSLTDTKLAEKLLNTDEKKQQSIDRNPLKQIGQPEQIADMACTILANRWMTGQIVSVDGGMGTLYQM